MAQNTAIFAGSFDPFTQGHLDIVKRAQQIFGSVVVLIAINSSKKSWLSLETRLDLIAKSTAHLPGVEVVSWNGLTVDYMLQRGSCVLVRGVRSGADLDWERSVAWANRSQKEDCETCFLISDPQWQSLSSSLVRELFQHQGQIQDMLPKPVFEHIQSLGKST